MRDLTVELDGRLLVDHVSFDLAPGARVGLIGESGSGKSLTALAIMGLLSDELRASGSARLGGTELIGLPERELAPLRGSRIAMVFQEPMTALDPMLRVGQQVAEVVRLHRDVSRPEALARAEQLLVPGGSSCCEPAATRISPPALGRPATARADRDGDRLRPRRPRRRRADDRPRRDRAGADPRLLRRLVDELGMALLLITHDLPVIASTCERVLVLHDGRVVERGATGEVFATSQEPYTRAMLTGTRALSEPRPPSAAPAARPVLLEARGLVREYAMPRTALRQAPPSVRALRGVDLSVERGDRFGIVGESGSGKTTLARLLLALDQPQSGEVRFDGQQVSGRKERELRFLRRQAQIVFQDPMGSLDPRMRVREILREPLRALDVPGDHGARVRELLDAVGLPAAAASRYPHEFSGGQRQRIAIARALAPAPALVIADEPVSALDVSVRAQILDLLRELADALALTLVFISHDLSVVRYLCDRIAVMHDGLIVETGTVGEVYDAPQHAYTRALLAAVPTL